ncbi:hypothetical protein CDAR_280871 [Caerostris darwini]|uniref:Uncharacterized protein n=1 Tax=Caerostris darwini TaxID=1538125 RepID=A0AAV4VUH7_9ARAC|nr:hypothetical protein CDAR_280871 [Caerostris darwini]
METKFLSLIVQITRCTSQGREEIGRFHSFSATISVAEVRITRKGGNLSSLLFSCKNSQSRGSYHKEEQQLFVFFSSKNSQSRGSYHKEDRNLSSLLTPSKYSMTRRFSAQLLDLLPLGPLRFHHFIFLFFIT